MRSHWKFRLDELDAAEPGQPGAEPTLPLPRKPDAEWLARTWQHAREEAGRRPNGVVLALDEIQAVPQWSSTIKGLWDADCESARALDADRRVNPLFLKVGVGSNFEANSQATMKPLLGTGELDDDARELLADVVLGVVPGVLEDDVILAPRARNLLLESGRFD